MLLAQSRSFRKLCAGAAAALLLGCTANPMTGRSQLKIVSADSAIAQSATLYSSLVKELRQEELLLDDDDPRVARVRRITNRLIDVAVGFRPESAKWLWSIEVIDDDDSVNAFCMPGGRMAVYTGLLDKLRPSNDELAYVLGHEIAHALADHGAEKMSMGMVGSAVALGAAAAAKKKNRDGVYAAATLAAFAFVKLPNSRTTEEEADRLGLELAARAGYAPSAGATLWQKMMKATGDRSRFDFLSTHPATPKRIDELRALEPAMEVHYNGLGRRPAPIRIAWVTTQPERRDAAAIAELTAGGARTFRREAASETANAAAAPAVATPAKAAEQPVAPSREREPSAFSRMIGL